MSMNDEELVFEDAKEWPISELDKDMVSKLSPDARAVYDEIVHSMWMSNGPALINYDLLETKDVYIFEALGFMLMPTVRKSPTSTKVEDVDVFWMIEWKHMKKEDEVS